MVERKNSDGGNVLVEQWNSDGGTVVEEWNSDSGTVLWNIEQ